MEHHHLYSRISSTVKHVNNTRWKRGKGKGRAGKKDKNREEKGKDRRKREGEDFPCWATPHKILDQPL